MMFSTLTPRMVRAARATALASALAIAALPALAGTNATGDDAAQQNREIVREAFDRWAAGGSVFDILSPGVIWTIHGSGPVAGTYDGIVDFTQRASRPLVSRLAEPLVPEVHDIWAVGDTVIIRFDASSTTTSGQPYRNQFVWIFRLEDGEVAEAEAFLDLAAYQAVVDNNEPRSD